MHVTLVNVCIYRKFNFFLCYFNIYLAVVHTFCKVNVHFKVLLLAV